MVQNKFTDAASKVDEAHKRTSSHLHKEHKHSNFRSFVSIVLVILLLLGGWFLGPRGVAFIIEQTSKLFTQDATIEEVVIEPETSIDPVEVTGVLESIEAVSGVIQDPGLRVSRNVSQGALDAYNLTLDTQRRTPERPLALNFVNGSTNGVIGAIFTSLGFAEIDKELLTVDTGAGGIDVGTNLGQPIADPVTLDAKTQLLQRIDNVLALDPFTVVGTGFVREEQYTQYVRELTQLVNIAEKVGEDLSREIDSLRDDVGGLSTERTRLEQLIEDETAQLRTQGLENRLDEFNIVNSRLAGVQSRLGVLTQLQALYTVRFQSLNLRLEGVQQNRDALIRNVRVTPVEGSGVDVVQ